MESSFLIFAADSGVGRDAMLVTLGGAILALISELIKFGFNTIGQKRADKKEEQGRVESHLDKRVKRLERDAKRNERNKKRLTRRVRVLENSNTQMAAYIKNSCGKPNAAPYEEIPLPADEDDEEEEDEEEEPKPGTGTHATLKPNEE